MLAVTLAPGWRAHCPPLRFSARCVRRCSVYALAVKAGAFAHNADSGRHRGQQYLTAGVNAITLLFPDDVIGATGFMLGGFSGVTLSSVGGAAWYLLAGLLLAFVLAADLNVS